jgi:hypothetical protein
MTRLIAATALAVGLSTAALAMEAQGLPAPAAGGSETVSVHVDRTAIQIHLGAQFVFTSTVRNDTTKSLSGLIAHLNVFSTDPKTYVDPEDWSSRRTQFLKPLPVHGSATLTWHGQAVNSGPLVLYVAVTDTARKSVSVSAPIEMAVKNQKSIDAAGILPLAIGIPAAVGVLLVFTLWRRRREIDERGT